MALISCPECGVQISDKADCCPNCGCPNSEFKKQSGFVENSVENAKMEDNNGRLENIADNFNAISMQLGYGAEITFDVDQDRYIRFARPYNRVTLKLKGLLAKKYREKVHSFADIYTEGYDILLKCYKKYIEFSVGRLFKCGIENYDFERFFMMVEEVLSVEDALAPLTEQALDICRENDRLKANVAVRSANRGRWVGGGFGISGALAGAAKAGILNLGSDIVHSIGDSVSNSRIDDRINELQERVFKDPKTLVLLCDALIKLCSSAFKVLQYILSEYGWQPCGNFNFENASAIFKNYRKLYENGKISIAQLYGGIAQSLSCYPYQEEVYIYLYDNFRDQDRLIHSIVKYIGFEPEYLSEILLIDFKAISKLELHEGQTIEELEKNRGIYEVILKSNPNSSMLETKLKISDFDDAINDIIKLQKEEAEKVAERLRTYDDTVDRLWNLVDGKNGSSEYMLELYLFTILADDMENKTGGFDIVMGTIQKWARSVNAYKQKYALYLQCKIMEKMKSTKEQVGRTMLALCEGGVISAIAEVGYYYFSGNGIVEKDTDKAVELFTYAAKRSSPMGMAWMGFLLYDGEIVDSNVELGLELIKKAAYYKYPLAVEAIEKLNK